MGRFQLPMRLQAPPAPIRTREIRVDERTTPARLALRAIGAAPRFTIPAALLSVTHQLGEALVPVVMGVAIDRAVRTGDPAQLLLWMAVLAADFAMLSFSYRFGSRIAELGALAVQHRLREIVATHLLTRPPTRAAWSAPGVALSLATSDVNRLAATVAIAVYPVGELAAVLFGGAVLLAICWPLGLAVLLGAPALLWLTDRAGASLQQRSSEEQAAAAAAAGEAADLMAGYRVVKGIRAEREAAARYRRASRAALAGTLRARHSEGVFTGAMSLVTGLFLTAIAVAAGLLALRGAFGLAELITVIGLAQFLIFPLQNLASGAGSSWAAGIASAARLLELLRESESEGAQATRREAESQRNAASRAAAAVTAAFADEADEIVAVAATGHRAREVLDALGAEASDALIAPHGAHLFTGSVRENVALPGTDPRRVEAALLAAQCRELARALPDGLDTQIGEGGNALSGGQRQRVALARALAHDAPLLVLHEPTTAVDAVTEAAIAAAVRELQRGRRTVLVTCSPALLRVADRVIRVPEEA